MAPALTPTTIAGGLAVLYAVYYVLSSINLYLARQKFAKANHCEPLTHRYPYKDPFFAIDLMLQTREKARQGKVLETNQKRFQLYGRTFKSRLMENPAIVTMEPENIKTVLSLKFKDFQLTNRMRLLGKLLGKGIFTSDGEDWHNSRALLRPNFARDQLADIEAFERHFEYFVKAIPTDGTTVDLQELFFRMTIDSATEFLFGESVHSLRMAKDTAGPNESNFSWAFNYSQHAAVERSRFGPFGFLVKDETYNEAVVICHEFVDRYVEKAFKYREMEDLEAGSGKKEDDEKYVFLYELAKATKDKVRLRSEMMNILLAGRDTTASLLSNMFFVIAKRPEIWKKLRQEIDDTLQGVPPTYEQLRNLKYLKYCLNECKFALHHVVAPETDMI